MTLPSKVFDIVLMPTDFASGMHIMMQSVFLVGIAEMFDKTWFIALLMALRHDRRVVFLGSVLALFVHTFIAAALGIAISKFFGARELSFMAAVLYLVFAAMCAFEWFNASKDSDVFQAGKEEAASSIAGALGPTSQYGADVEASQKSGKNEITAGKQTAGQVLCQCFGAVFVAEWGDRTQIAMVSQHASQPVIPVCIGSAAAFFLLTLSAVWVASLLDRLKLSERSVHGISAVSFAFFAAIAFSNGLAARQQQ